ncbi:MAG: ATP-binding cassette domain-containing protein, partial [bacterium]
RRRTPGATKLRVDRLTRYGFFLDISFQVHEGEILGIGGLCGAGRTELARSLVGADPVDSGEVLLNERKLRNESMAASLKAGIAYLTEERKAYGLALRLSTAENVLSALIPRLSAWWHYSRRKGRPVIDGLIKQLEIRPDDCSVTVRNLSGGNQQKVLLAKWLALGPEVLILDEPTRGVDIGAKVVIHKAIEDLAEKGAAVILISSDLPELVSLSDRIMIMRHGRFVGEMARDQCSEETVLLAANGGVMT